MESIANKIIWYCKKNEIPCGKKMMIALHYVESKGGKASLEDIFKYCKKELSDNPPRMQGLRAYFNKYNRHKLLYFNDDPWERVVEFKYTVPDIQIKVDINQNQYKSQVEDMDDNKNSLKAQKHIQISIKIKSIVNEIHPNWNTYLATYTLSRTYQKIEEESGEEFWSIKLHSWIDNSELKDSDVVIVNENKVIYFIEVKWGAVNGSFDSDIMNFLSYTEQKKLREAREYGRTLYVRGPAVQNKIRYRHEEFPPEKVFTVDGKTQFLLVADFYLLKQMLNPQKYQNLTSELKKQKEICDFLDIENRVDDIKSFREYIKI